MPGSTPPDAQLATLAAAYEGVEGQFADAAEVAAYRQAVLRKTEHQRDVIAALLGPEATLLEIGCGNGRLLIALADRLRAGIGIDLARSRVAFARAWAQDAGQRHLTFIAGDAL